MKKALRITAIILCVVTVLVTHPFLSVEAKEIINKKFMNNSSYPEMSISYTYYVENPQFINTDLNSDNQEAYEYTEFVCEVNIFFKKAYTGEFTLYYYSPNGWNQSTRPEPAIYVTGAREITHAYNQVTFEIYNSQYANVKFVLSYNRLYNYYGYYYSTNDPDPGYSYSSGNMWIGDTGSSFFNIDRFEYRNLVANSSLDDIHSDATDIYNLLTSLYTNQQNRDLYEKWINGVFSSQNHIYNGGLYDLNSIYSFASSDSSDQTLYGKFTITQYEPRDENVYIILALPRNTGNDQLIYFKYPNGVGSTEMANYVYIYDLDTNYIYRYGLWSSRVNGVSYFRISTDRLSLTNFTVTNRTDFLNSIYITNSPVNEFGQIVSTNKKLDTIIDLLQHVQINVTNQQVTNVTNQYDTNINYVYNVENNLSTQLDQRMQQFTPDNTNILQRLNDSSILLKSVINQINGIEIFSIPIAVTLVGIVLMAIIG